MIKEKEKLKSSQDLDFLKIVEDQRPESSEVLEDTDEGEHDSNYVFFCKDCKEVVETNSFISRGKKLYSCKVCGSERVVSGFEKSLKKYFRVK